jgi:hypothetical protein
MKLLPRVLAITGLALLSLLPTQAQVVPLIESGDTWKYFNNGTAPAANWKTTAFNDTTWASAPSSFGYRVTVSNNVTTVDSNTATTQMAYSATNDPNNKYITTYFRKTVNLTSNSFPSILLGLRYDDGVVVYVNGTEVRRENMPAGTPTNTTLAPAALNVQGMNTKTISFPSQAASPFVVGNNVIAVELHQNAITSSDIFFDMTLSASTTQPAFGDAQVGVFQTFESDVDVLTLSDIRGYARDEPGENQVKQEMQYAFSAVTQSNPSLSQSAGVFGSIAIGGTRQLRFQTDTIFELVTERIKADNYKNIKAFIELRSENNAVWPTTDFVKGFLQYSTDGVFFTEVPWFSYQAGAVPPVTTTLIDISSPFHWQAPTIHAAPASTVTNPTDWMNLVPATWTNYNTPPTPTGANRWRPGNLPASTIKGGVGYDRISTSGVNYLPQLDSGSIAAVETDMYNKETRANIRYPFTIPAGTTLASITKVELALRFEDAVGVWLNGVKIISDLEPSAAITSPNTSTAVPANRDDNTANTPKIYDITSLFKQHANAGAGNTNVLALRGYNAALTSSDFMVQAKLTMQIPGPPDPNGPAGLDQGGIMTELNSGSLIPDNIRALKIKIQGQLNPAVSDLKYFFFDNFRVTGDAISAIDLGSSLVTQLPTNTYTNAQRELNADPDGDGIKNLIEYAMGGNAAVAQRYVTTPGGIVQPLSPEIINTTGNRITMQFRMLASQVDTAGIDNSGSLYNTELKYTPQASQDMNFWEEFGNFYLNGPIVQNDDGTQTVTITTLLELIGNPSQDYKKRFFRLEVTPLIAPWLVPLTPSQVAPFPE